MRVFYEEEEVESKRRRYYVKIDNMNMPEDLKGFKAIEARTIEELKSNIKDIFELNKSIKYNIELWSSSNYQGKRLDLENIPEEIEFIWVRLKLI